MINLVQLSELYPHQFYTMSVDEIAQFADKTIKEATSENFFRDFLAHDPFDNFCNWNYVTLANTCWIAINSQNAWNQAKARDLVKRWRKWHKKKYPMIK